MRTLKTINAVEGELTQLLSALSKEADGLRTKLERRRLLSGSRGRPGGPPVLEAEVSEGELGMLSPGATPAVEEPPAPEEPPVPEEEPAPEEPAAEEPEAETPEVDEAAPAEGDDTPVETADEPAQPEDAQPDEPAAVQVEPPRGLDEEARTAVAKTMSDVELAELYALASVRVVEKSDDDKEASYWMALQHATVDEAVSRPDFGRPGEDEDLGGRRQRRQRRKLLEPLIAAREEALGGSAGY